MAYNYLDEKQLKDALVESEAYMRDFWKNIPELQRITRGKPGKVPKGKPRVTDGTLAGIRREMPKQIIQRLPSGRAIIHGHEDYEDYANAVLTDIILCYANSGGTPYAKAKRAIRNTVDIGSAWAECFFNRTGDILHADYKILTYNHVLFEKGKVSEFDLNFMPIVEYYTKTDLLAIIKNPAYKDEWDFTNLQALIDSGEAEKDADQRTEEEKKQSAPVGYFKVVTFYQRGVGATFYKYAPKIDKVVWQKVSTDPRGIIPVHGLVAEDDDYNPLGEPLARISAGKQNLLDFDMQMYQYGQGMAYSPPTKLWGNTPESKIKIAPDAVIKLNGTRATDDFEAVNLSNQATSNFANNYGLIKSQILNETGRTGDTSIDTSSGNVGFGKTPAAIKQNGTRLSASDNDINLSYELWQGRVYETLLNIHFAESSGNKQLELESETIQRYKFNKRPTVNYDADIGKIKFKVNASTSRQMSDEEMAANMQQIQPLMTPQNSYYLGQIGWKLDVGEFNKQLLQRLSVDSMDKILTKMNDKEAADAKKQPFPIIDQPQFRINSADLSQEQITAILQQQGGVQVQPGGDPHIDLVDIINDPTTPPSVKAQIQQRAGLQPDLATQNQLQSIKLQQEAPQASPDKAKSLGETVQWKPGDLTPEERSQALAQVGIAAEQNGVPTANELAQASDTAIKTDKHATDTAIAQAKLEHEQRTQAMSTAMDVQKTAHSQALAEHAAVQPKPVGATK